MHKYPFKFALTAAITMLFLGQLAAQQPSKPRTDADRPASVDQKAKHEKLEKKNRPQRGNQQDGKRDQQQTQQKSATLFKRLDQNQDGQLSESEIPKRMQKMIARMDLSNDGTVSLAEFSSAMKNRLNNGDARDVKSVPGQTRSDSQEGRPGKRMEMNPAMLIKRIDRDGDERLTLEEVPERMKEKFARIDTDGDSFIDQQELTAAVERMKGGETKGRYDSDPEKSKGQIPNRPPRRDDDRN